MPGSTGEIYLCYAQRKHFLKALSTWLYCLALFKRSEILKTSVPEEDESERMGSGERAHLGAINYM